MINLLIELYDFPCGLDYYYIQNNEIKEFGDEIFKKLNEISIVVLTGGSTDGGTDMEGKGKKAKRNAMEGMSFEEKFEFAFQVSYFAMWIAIFAVVAVLNAVGII